MGQRNLGPTAPGKPLRTWALGAPGFLGPGAFGALRFDGFCHPRRPLRVIIGARPCLQLEASCDMDEKLTNQVSIMNDLRKCMPSKETWISIKFFISLEGHVGHIGLHGHPEGELRKTLLSRQRAQPFVLPWRKKKHNVRCLHLPYMYLYLYVAV